MDNYREDRRLADEAGCMTLDEYYALSIRPYDKYASREDGKAGKLPWYREQPDLSGDAHRMMGRVDQRKPVKWREFKSGQEKIY